ncbi:MAG: hypothetical protein GY925_26870 [Actinomycetia bacterium]|nr:hypothetical protein [Actinomycetes bacterium]
MWVIPLVGSAVAGEWFEEDAFLEGLGVLALATANIGAIIRAFRHQRQGGTLLLITGGLFSVFAIATAGRNHWFAALVSGGPFVLSGALFLTAAAKSRDAQTVPRVPESTGAVTGADSVSVARLRCEFTVCGH